MSAYTWVYVQRLQILASKNLWVFLKSSSATAFKFHIRIIDIFSYYEGKWIFSKTKIISVAEVSLESDKTLVLQLLLFGSLIPQGSLVLGRTALNSTVFCGKHLKHSWKDMKTAFLSLTYWFRFLFKLLQLLGDYWAKFYSAVQCGKSSVLNAPTPYNSRLMGVSFVSKRILWFFCREEMDHTVRSKGLTEESGKK